MARFARVVAVDVPHHVTQRGNARQLIFHDDIDRTTYLELVREYAELYGVSLWGYCLMSNHVHWIAVPHAADSLAQCLKQVQGRFAAYWNARRQATGHVWQGRFYSCPLGETHLWPALRYVELNPVRAGMVAAAVGWRWSSAVAHSGDEPVAPMLAMEAWRKRWTSAEWAQYLAEEESQASLLELRRSTHSGRPLGSRDFVAAVEQASQRPLAPRKGGRPRKPSSDSRQDMLTFVA
jgi:putative transposase